MTMTGAQTLHGAVLILASDGTEESELAGPRDMLRAAGYDALIASPGKAVVAATVLDAPGRRFAADLALEEAARADAATPFAGLLLPGGLVNPDRLRREAAAVDLVRAFMAGRRPVAAICHGPWLLAEAGVLTGRHVTSWPAIRRDLEHAGAHWSDAPVVVDDRLVTSRMPDDVPAFAQALLDLLRATKN